MERAYSVLTIEKADGELREIVGLATTPALDRLGDIVEPGGAEFQLPMPLLFLHRRAEPVGHVTHATVTPAGIRIVARLARSDEPGRLKDRLDECWHAVKAGLLRGLSIGFQPVKGAVEQIVTGVRYRAWRWVETSLVTIPCNMSAGIEQIRMIDQAVRPATQGATPSPSPAPKRVTPVKALAELGAQDDRQRGFEFCRAVRHFAAARGVLPDALEMAEGSRAPSRVLDVLKAAVGAGSTGLGSPSPWGDELVGYQQLANGFYESLRGRSAFFTILQAGGFNRVPLRTRFNLATSNASGWLTGTGRPVPLARLNLAAGTLDPVRAAALMVVSEELLRSAAPGAEGAFGRELRGAVADTVDAAFFGIIGQGVTVQSATADPDADILTLLDLVSTTGTGTLYWTMPPALANAMATLRDTTSGQKLFPEMTPTGGSIVGLPALVSTQVPAIGSPATVSLWLLDGSGIAANALTIEVGMSRQADVEMDTEPGQDAGDGTGAQMVSLWQTNSVGLLASVWFGAERIRSNAVAVLSEIAW